MFTRNKPQINYYPIDQEARAFLCRLGRPRLKLTKLIMDNGKWKTPTFILHPLGKVAGYRLPHRYPAVLTAHPKEDGQTENLLTAKYAKIAK